MERDQERVGSYVLDIVKNGHWLLQHDVMGNVASKPPLFNWIAAVATTVAGGASQLSLAFPSAAASLALFLVLLGVAARRFGRAAALWVVPLGAFSSLGLRQVLLVRSDVVFAFFTTIAALAVWRAWQRGAGWIWVGLALALATMTKGPHAALFALVGLMAVVWEKRSGSAQPLRGRRWPAILVFLSIPALWLTPACLQHGTAVLDKLFVDELVGHAFGYGQGQVTSPGRKFGHPWAWFLTRLFPMSFVAVAGLWRVLRRPAADPDERRFERFLTCWLVGGLLILSLQSTVRFIHLLPMMPPAALLAAREFARLLQRAAPAWTAVGAVVGSGIALLIAWGYLHGINARNPAMVESERIHVIGADVAARFDVEQLEFVDAPVALQLHLDVYRRVLDPDAAQRRLAAIDPVLLAVRCESRRCAVTAPFVHARYALTDTTELLLLGNTARVGDAGHGSRSARPQRPPSSARGLRSRGPRVQRAIAPLGRPDPRPRPFQRRAPASSSPRPGRTSPVARNEVGWTCFDPPLPTPVTLSGFGRGADAAPALARIADAAHEIARRAALPRPVVAPGYRDRGTSSNARSSRPPRAAAVTGRSS